MKKQKNAIIVAATLILIAFGFHMYREYKMHIDSEYLTTKEMREKYGKGYFSFLK